MRMIKYIKSVILLGILLNFMGCAVVFIPAFNKKGDLIEKEIEESKSVFTLDKILIVDITGIITMENSKGILSENEGTVAEIKDILKKAKNDDDIKAVILRINSPGGGVTASDVIYHEISKFKEDMKKDDKEVVITAAFMDIAASGGYYIAQSADKIYALDTTLTGSIGVISVFPKIEGLAQKIGWENRVIKSGEMKDLGSLFRDFSPEERDVLQKIIDSMYGRFVDTIAENRKNLTREEILKLADGRVYTAQQALDNGLIDGVCYFDEMIDKTKESAGIEDASIITYKRPGDYKSNIYSSFKQQDIEQINLLNININPMLNVDEPKFFYLWLP